MIVPTLVVDRTHLGRRVSGIERITAELFSNEILRPLPVRGFGASAEGKLAVVAAQMAGTPLAMMRRPKTLWVFSGFPPSPLAAMFRDRAVMYVHDMFLMTRRQDLNRAAKLYMAAPFRFAVERLRYFFVNSVTTAANLRPHVRQDAEIRLYRPQVRNVFGLAHHADPGAERDPIVLGAVGTIEPRKNFLAAAAIALELGRKLNRRVELQIIGRAGWGEDFARLSQLSYVKLHGFLPEAAAQAAMKRFDALICTSHDEGLGLPLLEAQYGGLQSIAPDQPVFREVLGDSGLYVDPQHPRECADRLAAWLGTGGWRMKARHAGQENIQRWNALAQADREEAIDFLSRRLAALAGKSFRNG